MIHIQDLSGCLNWRSIERLRETILSIPLDYFSSAEYGLKRKLSSQYYPNIKVPKSIRIFLGVYLKKHIYELIKLRYISTNTPLDIDEKSVEHSIQNIIDGNNTTILRYSCLDPMSGRLKMIQVKISYQLSVMVPGSYISPHTDARTKHTSSLIYLPTKEQSDSVIMGTNFYVPKNRENVVMPEESDSHVKDIKIFELQFDKFTVPYSGMKGVVFCRSDDSWHSVYYDKKSDLGDRVSINVNLDFVL